MDDVGDNFEHLTNVIATVKHHLQLPFDVHINLVTKLYAHIFQV